MINSDMMTTDLKVHMATSLEEKKMIWRRPMLATRGQKYKHVQGH